MANFDVLLSKLNAVDEGLESLEKADFDTLIGDIKDKVDSIYYVLTKLDAESGRLGNLIKEMQAKKKAVDNSASRLKEWSAFAMYRRDMPYLEGENFTVKVMSREATKINENITLDSKAFMTYQGLIKRSYSWDKLAVKDAIKAGKFENIGEIVESRYVKFSPKGKAKK